MSKAAVIAFFTRAAIALVTLMMYCYFALANIVAIIWLPFVIVWWVIRNLNSDRDYVYRVGKAMDQVANAANWAGNSKETVSSHVGRLIKREREQGVKAPAWAHFINNVTSVFQKDHCINSIEAPFINEPM